VHKQHCSNAAATLRYHYQSRQGSSMAATLRYHYQSRQGSSMAATLCYHYQSRQGSSIAAMWTRCLSQRTAHVSARANGVLSDGLLAFHTSLVYGHQL
jgi:hypothetical protein